VGVVGLGGVVENYILVLLYNVIVQSTIFTNLQFNGGVWYLNVVHEQHVQYNKQ
jgi:hypothetical protein